MSSLPSERTQLQSHPLDTPAQPDTEREKEIEREIEGENRELEPLNLYSPIRAKPTKVFPFSLMVPRKCKYLGHIGFPWH